MSTWMIVCVFCLNVLCWIWPANAAQRRTERTRTVFMVMINRLFCVEKEEPPINIQRERAEPGAALREDNCSRGLTCQVNVRCCSGISWVMQWWREATLLFIYTPEPHRVTSMWACGWQKVPMFMTLCAGRWLQHAHKDLNSDLLLWSVSWQPVNSVQKPLSCCCGFRSG